MADLNQNNSACIEELKISRDLLPLEKDHQPPREIYVTYNINNTKDDAKDTDYFIDMDSNIVREVDNESVRVSSNDDLREKFNKYNYDDKPNEMSGVAMAVLSCGIYYWAKRQVIKDGNFGHFISAGRHMLTRAGITAQLAPKNAWAHNFLVPCDMEGAGDVEVVKHLGSKTILTVQENCIAGAFRIGTKEENSVDGEFVLFTQGRYVLHCIEYGTDPTGGKFFAKEKEENTRKIFTKNLVLDRVDNIVPLGPVKICFIKEGFIGGAYKIYTGKYEIFPPGPPYILHEKEYEQIQILERKQTSRFQLGPITFITIRDGQLGGAYNKHTGRFEILPPGNTYKLDKRDYSNPEIKQRKDLFKLGPYTFITVKSFMLAGVYKKKGGQFIILPPGSTYQLSEEDYEEPIMVKNNKHRVTIGPLTYLTLEAGTLSGAYRHSDGVFEEFKQKEVMDADNKVTYEQEEFLLHCTQYHSILTIPKYKYTKQNFGPFKVITIRNGYQGVFMKEGVIEIHPPGFYRLDSSHTILESIPTIITTNPLKKILFKAKDGVRMSCDATIIWKVLDGIVEGTDITGVAAVTLYPGGYRKLYTDVQERFITYIRKFSKLHNRERLLPTKQDVMIRKRNFKKNDIECTDSIAEIMDADMKISKLIYNKIEEDVKDLLTKAGKSSRWGVTIIAVRLHTFGLEDKIIMDSLNKISEIVLTQDLVNVEGTLAMAKAEASRQEQTKTAEATAECDLKRATAKAEVDRINSQARAEVQEALVEAKCEAKTTKAEMESEAQVKRVAALAVADAARREILLKIKTDQILQRAEAKAEAMKLVAEANYTMKDNQNKAAAFMTDKQFKLTLLEKSVDSMGRMGDAAWRMPDKYMKFYDQFAPMVKLNNQ